MEATIEAKTSTELVYEALVRCGLKDSPELFELSRAAVALRQGGDYQALVDATAKLMEANRVRLQ